MFSFSEFQEDAFCEKATNILDNLPSITSKVLYPQSHNYSCAVLAMDMIIREVSEWEERLLAIRTTLQTIIDTIHNGGILTNLQESICRCVVENTVPKCWSVSSFAVCILL